MAERTLIVLTIREVPKSINSSGGGTRAHPMKAHSEKKRWEGLYLLELMAAKVPKGMSHVRTNVTVFWKRRNHQEKENYRQSVIKPFADALKKGGYIEDDSDDIFEVGDFAFAYPTVWPFSDAQRIKSYMLITLEATYDD